MARRKKNQENANETEDFKPTPLNDNDPELETAYLNSYPVETKDIPKRREADRSYRSPGLPGGDLPGHRRELYFMCTRKVRK